LALFQGWVVVSKRLDPGSLPGMTQYIVWGYLFQGWLLAHILFF